MNYHSTAARLVMITAIVTSISGNAFARQLVRPGAQDYRAVYDETSSSDAFAAYNRDLNGIPCGVACSGSGTAERLGLGANPAHPEGPGNSSN